MLMKKKIRFHNFLLYNKLGLCSKKVPKFSKSLLTNKSISLKNYYIFKYGKRQSYRKLRHIHKLRRVSGFTGIKLKFVLKKHISCALLQKKLNIWKLHNAKKLKIRIFVNSLINLNFHLGYSKHLSNRVALFFVRYFCYSNFIIDLTYTLFLLKNSFKFLSDISKSRGRTLFIGSGSTLEKYLIFFSKSCFQCYITKNWRVGTLTSFRTFTTLKEKVLRLRRLIKIELLFDRIFAIFERSRSFLYFFLQYAKGCKFLRRLPDAICISSSYSGYGVYKESRILGIPSIVVVNTDANPIGSFFSLVGNDTSPAISFLLTQFFRLSIFFGFLRSRVIFRQVLQQRVRGLIAGKRFTITLNNKRFSPHNIEHFKLLLLSIFAMQVLWDQWLDNSVHSLVLALVLFDNYFINNNIFLALALLDQYFDRKIELLALALLTDFIYRKIGLLSSWRGTVGLFFFAQQRMYRVYINIALLTLVWCRFMNMHSNLLLLSMLWCINSDSEVLLLAMLWLCSK